MSTDSRKIKFLAGSPTAQSLKWDDGSLLSTFCPQVQRYIGEEIEEEDQSQTTTTSFTFPAWRLVNFQSNQQTMTRTKSSQQLNLTHGKVRTNANDDRLNFLEHSYAVIQDLQSSQIQVPDETFADTTTGFPSFTDNTFSTTTTSFATSEDSTLIPTAEPFPQPLDFSGTITDLNRIPSALHLQRIQPQTVTVNLIAGIISISAPRTVSLRRRPDIEMQIVELLVGDDTHAGFNISFWLSVSSDVAAAAASAAASQAMATTDGAANASDESAAERERLNALRPGDVVLLTNVALSDWKGCVYGQSLNRRTTRNRTSVTVMTRSKGVSGLITGKVSRVVEWTDWFVGTGRLEKRGVPEEGELWDGQSKRRCVEEVEVLPPDTQ